MFVIGPKGTSPVRAGGWDGVASSVEGMEMEVYTVRDPACAVLLEFHFKDDSMCQLLFVTKEIGAATFPSVEEAGLERKTIKVPL